MKKEGGARWKPEGVVCMSIVVDICDRALLLDIFFTFPPAGPQTKGLVKSLDFPTQFTHHQHKNSTQK